MKIVLPPDLEKYVESLVQNGRYGASNEVIAEALREHQVSQPSRDVVMTPELEKLLDEGMEDIEEVSTTEQLRQGR